MNNGIALAQFGTFDVENYGDLLYPIVFQKMLERRDGPAEIAKFSLRGGNPVHDSGYETRPVRELFSPANESSHTLVIGGGDLLRTDWDVMASHYRSTAPQKGWWRKLATQWGREPVTSESEFRRKYMDYPGAGPFIIRPDGGTAINSVAYCSCGVPFPLDETPIITDAFDDASFIYVRDHASRNALLRAGVKKNISVGPDLIVALSDFFDLEAERDKGKKILQAHGVDVSRQVLIVQSNPQPAAQAAELVRQLKAHQARTHCEVVLLPLGWCHGDREFLEQLAAHASGTFKCVELHSIFEIIATLAAADVFLGPSLHGNITAFSFGVPHLFGPIQVAKREGFLDIVNLPADLKLESWEHTIPKLEQTMALGNEFFRTRATAAKKRVHEVFDEMCQAITARPAPPVAVEQFACG